MFKLQIPCVLITYVLCLSGPLVSHNSYTSHVVMAVMFDDILNLDSNFEVVPFIQVCLSAIDNPMKPSTIVGPSQTPLKLCLSVQFLL